MFPSTSTINSERKIQFAGILAAAIDRFTWKLVYINTLRVFISLPGCAKNCIDVTLVLIKKLLVSWFSLEKTEKKKDFP